MNNHRSLRRTVLLTFALGAVSAVTAFADTASTTTTTTPSTNAPTSWTGGGWRHHHRDHVLTSAERAELKNDKKQALAANSTLQAQATSLKQQFEALKSQGSAATQAQWQALHTRKQAYETQLRSAIENLDSGATALFAKIDAARAQHHHSN